MANVFNNIKDVGTALSKMAAGMLEDNLQFCKTVDKEQEGSFSPVNGYAVGDTINISIPPRFTPVTNTMDLTSSFEDIVYEKTPLALDTTQSIGVKASTLELATDIPEEEFIRRNGPVVESAMIALAHKVESDVIERATNAIYNTTGTAGSTTFNQATVLAAKDQLTQNLCPRADRKLLLSSAAMSSAIAARGGFQQDATQIAKQYREGYMGRADGFDYMENELLATHTNGNDVTFEVSTTVSAEGATTLVVEGLTTGTGTVTKGTTFTIDGVNMVHPQTKSDTGRLQKFVVTADATANGSGVATLNISPAIYTSASNGLQNVTAFPADGDTCNVLTGSASTGYIQNLAYHPSAFRLASKRLYLPTDQEIASIATSNNISVRLMKGSDITKSESLLRFDILYGFAAVRPEWACRITA